MTPPTAAPTTAGRAASEPDGDRPTIEVANPGRILDLAEHGKALARGGRYTVRTAGRSQEIVVDAAARAHGGPVVGRLIRF